MHQRIEADVALFGAGIAGLWLLARLRAAGFRVVLFESTRIGAGQTHAAQGIIHSGVKYGLGARREVKALGAMPELWRKALAGEGPVDLRDAKLLTPHCLFWVPRGFTGALTGWLAAAWAKSRVRKLARRDWPEFLAPEAIGAIYSLDEPVLDVASVAGVLSQQNDGLIGKIDWPDGVRFEVSASGAIEAVRLRRTGPGPSETIGLFARAFVFAAGQGNAAIIERLPKFPAKAQMRPLHMLLVKGAPGLLYAHCFAPGGVGTSDKPKLTITSHIASDGAVVWYVGGEIAEMGVALDREQLIERGRAELARWLPGGTWREARFASLRIGRAEAAQRGGGRPSGPSLVRAQNVFIAWPTKLALAPLLAEEALQSLQACGVRPAAGADPAQALRGWPKPALAKPPWEEASWF
jgi:glycine/D-amino acid oxidase-like deaminating enzyme